MSYIALYRKWRPSVFEDVVEQEHVVKTLKYSVHTGRIAHAYLFCGTRGTGKTTMAKIFSRAINCLNPSDGDPCNECEICKGILTESILDVIEIDAASNNSVDNVRNIRDEVIYAPSHAKYKVYIIDEVHMLSTGAFNALLKTLEEPPSHVVFILATTDPHKLPATILSRCQRFDFKRISVDSIVERITKIAGQGGVTIEKEAARLIARMSDGALRDAISILDQCISLGSSTISYNDVLSVIGVVNDFFLADIIDGINDRDMGKLLKLVDELVMNGKDVTQFVSDLVYYYRNLLLCKMTGTPGDIIEASPDTIEKLKKQSEYFDRGEIIFAIKELSALESGLKWASHPRILLEVVLVKLCDRLFNPGSNDVFERLSALENKINNASFTLQPVDKAAVINVSEKPAERVSRQGSEKPADTTPKSSPSGVTRSARSNSKPLENWDIVLHELKSNGRMVLYTNLLGSTAVELGDNMIGIIFKSGAGFNKTVVSKLENQKIVEAVLSQKTGREIKVKCLDEESFNESQKPQEKESDELLSKAQDIASRLNIPLNIIDE